MNDVVFVTGNSKKALNFNRHIGMDIAHQPADLDELQELNPERLVEHKLRQAYAQIGKPVLVEDVSFSFDAWGDLPGPFVKYFVDTPNGDENMCRMLDGFDNRRAVARCTFGYFDGSEVRFFEGKLHGEIATHPRGANGFGFDKVFVADSFDGKTAAELNETEYDRYYTAIKPFDKVREFLQTALQ